MGGDGDSFIMGFSSMNQLFWSTYLGGGRNDIPKGVFSNRFGKDRVYIVGLTTSNMSGIYDFPTHCPAPFGDCDDPSTNPPYFFEDAGDFFLDQGFIARLGISGFSVNNTNISLVKSSLKVFPNPNNGNFHIEGLTEKTTSIEIIDLNGKIVYQNKTIDNAKNLIDINLPDIPKGIYFLREYDGDFFNNYTKIIIQ